MITKKYTFYRFHGIIITFPYYGQGVAQDYQKSAYWFKLAANQGKTEAQFNLAILYYNGKGVTQNDQKADYWYEMAAKQGFKKP